MGNSRGPPDAREWHFRALGCSRVAQPTPRPPAPGEAAARRHRSRSSRFKARRTLYCCAEAMSANSTAAGASQAHFRSGPPSWRTARATAARASRAAARRLRGPAAQDKAHRAARWRADARRAGEHRVREPPARARPAFGPRALTWRTAHATAARASRAANRRHQAEPHKGKSTELLVAAPKHAAI